MSSECYQVKEFLTPDLNSTLTQPQKLAWTWIQWLIISLGADANCLRSVPVPPSSITQHHLVLGLRIVGGDRPPIQLPCLVTSTALRDPNTVGLQGARPCEL